jgi:hypothetical protein
MGKYHKWVAGFAICLLLAWWYFDRNYGTLKAKEDGGNGAPAQVTPDAVKIHPAAKPSTPDPERRLNGDEVMSRLDALVTELREEEKKRCKTISQVNNEAVSHVRILIPLLDAESLSAYHRKIKEIRIDWLAAGGSAKELAAKLESIDDYLDFGTNPRMNKSYQFRVLNVDVRHNRSDEISAFLMSCEGVDYGNDPDTVPWVRALGANRNSRLTAAELNQRYNHLLKIVNEQ